jgi:hypothetical protein
MLTLRNWSICLSLEPRISLPRYGPCPSMSPSHMHLHCNSR